VTNIRHLGIIFAFDLDVEMERYGNVRNQLFEYFMENGVYLRPLGNTIYITAPYITSDKEMQKIYDTIEGVFDRF